jgi:hypothetical protein
MTQHGPMCVHIMDGRHNNSKIELLSYRHGLTGMPARKIERPHSDTELLVFNYLFGCAQVQKHRMMRRFSQIT